MHLEHLQKGKKKDFDEDKEKQVYVQLTNPSIHAGLGQCLMTHEFHHHDI